MGINADSDGNGLSAEQADYFKGSKVRDAAGNLLAVYHEMILNHRVFKKVFNIASENTR